MSLIKTDSFELAVYFRGDPNSSKIALVLPGRLDTKDYSHMRSHVDYLANKGFFAVSFDPPGTWESPGDIRLYTMTNYLEAINELIKYYGNKPTFLMGHSRGATMAILAGTANPYVTAFAAVFSSFPVGGYKRKPKHSPGKFYPEKRDLPPGGGPKTKEFELPYSFFEDQLKHDFTMELKLSTKPKLFLLGKHDLLATPETVKRLYEVASKPKELYELDSGHDYRHSQKLITEMNGVIGTFLKKFNL